MLFIVGFATHMALLSRSGMNPSQIQSLLQKQDTDILSLQEALETEIARNEQIAGLLEQNRAQTATFVQQRKQAADEFDVYRTLAEKDRLALKEIEEFVHQVLQYHTSPATIEDIKNLKIYFAAIEAALPASEVARLEALEPYRDLKALLKRLPHLGL